MDGKRNINTTIEDASTCDLGLLVASCRGSHNVQLRHGTTLEISSETVLTPRGDCILCINSHMVEFGWCMQGKGAIDAIVVILPPWRGALSLARGRIIMCKLCGKFDRKSKSIVVRRSSFCDTRTLMYNCTGSASDLRKIIIPPQHNLAKVYVIFKCVSSSEDEPCKHSGGVHNQ